MLSKAGNLRHLGVPIINKVFVDEYVQLLWSIIKNTLNMNDFACPGPHSITTSYCGGPHFLLDESSPNNETGCLPSNVFLN